MFLLEGQPADEGIFFLLPWFWLLLLPRFGIHRSHGHGSSFSNSSIRGIGTRVLRIRIVNGPRRGIFGNSFRILVVVVAVVVVVFLLLFVVVVLELTQKPLRLFQPQQSLDVIVPYLVSHVSQILLDLRLGGHSPKLPVHFLQGQTARHVVHPVRIGRHEPAGKFGHGFGGGRVFGILKPWGDSISDHRQSLGLDQIVRGNGPVDLAAFSLLLLFLLGVFVGNVLVGRSPLGSFWFATTSGFGSLSVPPRKECFGFHFFLVLVIVILVVVRLDLGMVGLTGRAHGIERGTGKAQSCLGIQPRCSAGVSKRGGSHGDFSALFIICRDFCVYSCVAVSIKNL
mmetsp:Transcript_14836/g.37360  ORF Transcript_14836/g.37360 Transcript_14836/m.37360 type:complete len:340 (-) Transcript_14836:8-1027(-)